jgi:hypothetical protein
MNTKLRLVSLLALSVIAFTGSVGSARGLHGGNASSPAERLSWGGVPHGVAVATVKASHSNLQEEQLLADTRREIARARRATARYNDLSTAIADGYADINVFIPNMGFHYLKSSILDAQFDPERPELLVYAQDVSEGRMRLVAVEYAVPISLSPNATPEGFTGDADDWHRNEQFGLWTLHAWIWFRNPDGVFAELNSRVP